MHTDLDRFSLIEVSDGIFSMSLSGVYVECGLRIWPLVYVCCIVHATLSAVIVNGFRPCTILSWMLRSCNEKRDTGWGKVHTPG